MKENYQTIKLKNYFIEAKPEVLLTDKVVGAFMDLSVSWFKNIPAKYDRICYTRIGNHRLYKKQDILNWINRHCPLMLNTKQKLIGVS